MRFSEYISQTNKTQSQVASELDTSQGNISRWASGECVPEAKTIKKITEWSKGEVQPNDFYEVNE